jgi:predicted ester cyclase
MSHAERLSAFWSAFERGELDRIEAELMSPDIEFVMPGAPKLRGVKQVRQLWESWKAAFPDMKHQTVHAIEGADTYAAETHFTATHTGTLRSAQGEIAPTGKAIRWESADIVRLKDGKIASWHVYHDQMAMLGQLGLLGAEGAPA